MPWCARQAWEFAPLVVSTSGVPHADSLRFLELLSEQTVQAIKAQRAGADVDDTGAVMGASPPQLRGTVLARLKAKFSLIAMKAGCVHVFESLRVVDAAPVPPPPAAVLLVEGAAPAPPPLLVASAPVVQAVAVSAGGESYAGVLGGSA
jgi:hypothetical protein